MKKKEFFILSTEKNYKHLIIEDLILKHNYKNIMEIPKITEIILNTSSKRVVNDKKHLIPGLFALELITGQKITITKAKKSIATFKLRKNQVIGCKVSLRRQNKIAFFDKFIKIIMPRLPDFREINSASFDRKGNFNVGIDNLLIFAELENYFQYFDYAGGINISVQLSTKDLKEASLIFSSYQLPFVA